MEFGTSASAVQNACHPERSGESRAESIPHAGPISGGGEGGTMAAPGACIVFDAPHEKPGILEVLRLMIAAAITLRAPQVESSRSARVRP